MFRIVNKNTRNVEYFQNISSCNKALMVKRAQNWLSNHYFKAEADGELKNYQIEFSYFTWDNYSKACWGHSSKVCGLSDYNLGWRCTTVCALEQKGHAMSIGRLLQGRALEPNMEKKAKGGAYGELMLDVLGC